MRPLDGITVVSLEHAIAAPFCTRQLADLGARVIKIERPGVGDFARAYDERVRGLASHFVWTNRSQGKPDARRQAPARRRRSCDGCWRRADVLVQNLAPGAAARLGLSYEALHATHPRLIVCDISGYGDDGPYRDKKAYDLLIQSESGFLSITGTPDDAGQGRLLDRRHRRRHVRLHQHPRRADRSAARPGEGSRIDVSMLESMVEWMGYPLYYAFDGARAAAARRRGARDHLPVRPVPGRRRQDGDAGPAERARVGGLLRRGAAAAGAGDRRALRRQRAAHRSAATSCARSSSPPSRALTAEQVDRSGSTRRRSPMRA